MPEKANNCRGCNEPPQAREYWDMNRKMFRLHCPRCLVTAESAMGEEYATYNWNLAYGIKEK